MAPRTLPHIEGWPYNEIAKEIGDFRKRHDSRDPGTLWVGRKLWILLKNVSDTEDFLLAGEIPVKKAPNGLIEPSEFIITQ